MTDSQSEFSFSSEGSQENSQTEQSKFPQSKRTKIWNFEDKYLIFIDKARTARSYLKNKISITQLDSPETIDPESSIKKKDTRAHFSEVINQLLGSFECISWNIESQPVSSEEEEKEESKNEKLDQERGFINTITDVFDYHEEVGDNNWMFRALSRTTFGSPKYHAEVRAKVVTNITARSDRFSAG